MYLPPSKKFLQKNFKNIIDNEYAISMVLTNTYFDSEYYYKKNEDLQEHFEKNNFRALWTHYVQSGWEEGRFPFEVVVDEIFYTNTYPDVISFKGSVADHFYNYGYHEGRLPYQFKLNLEDYIKRLSILDASSLSPNNEKEMYQHFKESGYHKLLF